MVDGHRGRLPLSEDERALLAFLLENRGAVFTPETILSRLWWPHLPRDPDYLAGVVASLNQLLHEAGLPADMIESFHGVGYRLRPPYEAA
jgi:DNA-binding response OmpR family regulator